MGVADSFDGRFEILLLHVFLLLDRMDLKSREGKALSQALFDEMFKDMDQTLREIGIGDVGMPKHMKRMMLAFNGRMHAYSSSIEVGGEAFDAALMRNLYGTNGEKIKREHLAAMKSYIMRQRKFLAGQSDAALTSGTMIFDSVSEKEVLSEQR